MSFNKIRKEMFREYFDFLIKKEKKSFVLIFLLFCYFSFSCFYRSEDVFFPHAQVEASVGIMKVEKRTRGTDAFSFTLYEGEGVYYRYSVRGDYRSYQSYDGDRVKVIWFGVNFVGSRGAFEIYTVSDSGEHIKKILDYDKSVSWYVEKKKSSRFYSIVLPLFFLVLLLYHTVGEFNKERNSNV